MPSPQAWPQVPQSVALEVTSTQVEPQVIPMQTQTPASHASVAPHLCPQAPQASLSVSRSVHQPLQTVPAHTPVHDPSLHHSLAAQTCPQAPQFSGFSVSLTQMSPQVVAVQLQRPATHCESHAQLLPQAPQLSWSLWTSTKLSPHSVQVRQLPPAAPPTPA